MLLLGGGGRGDGAGDDGASRVDGAAENGPPEAGAPEIGAPNDGGPENGVAEKGVADHGATDGGVMDGANGTGAGGGGARETAKARQARGLLLQRRRVLADVAEGLAFLHERGVWHGALSAKNVLLDAEGRAKVGTVTVVTMATMRAGDLLQANARFYFAPRQENCDPQRPLSEIAEVLFCLFIS